ncbi:hypothetical protein BJ742DRAFT_815838 [Cladochytrium replicatum]|nr:hypothetical protein BJ742DRAFT_815838 [Cladochytrium replicatum]
MKVSSVIIFAVAAFATSTSALPNYNYGNVEGEVATTTPCEGNVQGEVSTPSPTVDVPYGYEGPTTTAEVKGANETPCDTSTPADVEGEVVESTPCETSTPGEVEGENAVTTPCETSTPAVEGEAATTTPCETETPTPEFEGENDEDCDEWEEETPGYGTPEATVQTNKDASYLQSAGVSNQASNAIAVVIASAALALSVALF